MTWKPNRRQRIHEARQSLASAQTEVREIAQTFRDQMRAAHVVPNRRDLSPAGVRKAQEAARGRARSTATAGLDAQRARVDAARSSLESLTASTEPDAAGEMRRARHWDRIRPLLEAGRSAARVVDESADPEVLLVLRQELPAYVAARAEATRAAGSFETRAGHVEDPDLRALLANIDARLVATASGHDAEAATARQALSTEVAAADLHLRQLTAEVAGHQSGLATAVAMALTTQDDA